MVRVKLGKQIYNISTPEIEKAVEVAKVNAKVEGNKGGLIWTEEEGALKRFYCISCNYVEVSPSSSCICTSCQMKLKEKK